MNPVLPERVAKSIDRFTGRAWLLSRLLEWWEVSDERLFLLTGGPGTGKSMILAWLAGFGPVPEDPVAQAQLASVRKAIKAAHFCQASSRNVSPQAFAESIANQLINGVEGFADALTATLAERVQITVTQSVGTVATGGAATGISIGRIDLGTLGDELSFDRAFTQPLKKLYADSHSEPMLLLVDALDEAQTYTGQVTLPDLLSRLADLPPAVRILATTRDEPRVLKFFRAVKSLDLIKDADSNVDDVRTYAEGRLAKLSGIEEAKRNDFAQRLARQANGVFLYAALVLDELLARSPAELPALDTYVLPAGLSGLYHSFLIRELGKDEPHWFDLYEPLLGLIAVAQGDGLTTEQLTDMVGKDIRAALRACKQYLNGELPSGPFRLFHKSFTDFLLDDPGNTDFRIQALDMHRRIAERYWHLRDVANSQVVSLECIDDYGLNHLSAHLAFAGWEDRLHSLLDDRWARIKESREGSLSGFLSDVGLAWQHAEAADRYELQVRYALFEASIRSLASNLPLSLLRALLQHRVWTPVQALRHVEQVSDYRQRAAAITILSEWLPAELVDEAVSLARAIPYDADKIEPLAALSARKPKPARDEIVCEVFGALGRLEYESNKAAKLCMIAAQLSEAGLAHALDIALAIRFDDDRARALAGLVAHLPESALLKAKDALWSLASDKALPDTVAALMALASRGPALEQDTAWQRVVDLACGAQDEQDKARALALIAPRVPDPFLPPLLAVARALRNSTCQAELVAVLLPRCPERERSALLRIGMQAVDQLGTGTDPTRVRARVAFLPSLSREEASWVIEVALAEARNEHISQVRATALALVIPHAPPELMDALRNEAMQGVSRPDALIALAACLPAQQARLIEIARSMQDVRARAEALGGMARHLPPAMLTSVLTATANIPDDEQRLRLLEDLAPCLPAELFPEALAIARGIRDADECAMATTALAEQLSPADCPLATERLVEKVVAIADPLARVRWLHRLARWLSAPANTLVWRRVVDTLCSLSPTSSALNDALADIAHDLPRQTGTEVLAMVDSWPNAFWQGQALLALAPILPTTRVPEAIKAIFDIPLIESRAAALVKLLPHLSEADRYDLARRILDQTRQAGESEAVGVFVTLGPHLPPDLLAEAQRIATGLQPLYGERARALVALLPYLPVERLPAVAGAVIEALGKTTNWQRRDETLDALVASGHLPPDVLDKVLETARSIGDHGFRARALAQLLPSLPAARRLGVVQEAMADCRAVFLPSDRMEIVIKLAPYLCDDTSWQDVFWGAYAHSYARDRARALLNYMPLVPQEDRPGYLANSVVQGSAWIYERDPGRGARERAIAWAGLLDEWRRHEAAEARMVWTKGLRALACRSRPDLLLDLAFLAPILSHLGGAESVAGSINRLEEAARMWP